MVSGVLLGILKQQHEDYLVLGVGAPIPLPAGLILERFDLEPSSRLTTAETVAVRW